MKEPDSLAHKQAILEYWTLVEFFSPYLIENALNHKQVYQKIYANESLSQPLPWLDVEIISENDPATPFAKGYHLYLGLFNIEETADRARHVFAQQPSQWQSVDWRSCAQTGSTTAFARILVTTHGIPLFGTLTLSTLPWAHGHLLNEKRDLLTIERYWKSVNRLLLTLREEFATHLPIKLMKKPKIEARYLDLDSLYKLVDLLYKWANYKPLDYPLILIEPLSGDNTQAVKEPKIHTSRDVPILNSFYIQDLEAAAITLTNQKGEPIDLYLSGKQEVRISLESEEGKRKILDTIRPENIPSGRWPDPISYQQSLMQQFAINATFNLLKERGIFSVNGPPGTGKTSLLREIITENIVARAASLSQFKNAQEAFIGKHALSFESSDLILISELDPSLLGYEMLVVSSNNTAVQNLSKELPLRSQLDSAFHHASYLEPIATKILGAKEGEVWGLISASLGNRENCRHFVENVFMQTSEVQGASRIWEWIEEYDGPSFAEAKDHFIKIKQQQEHLFKELEMLAFLHDEIYGQSVESYCAEQIKALIEIEEESEKIQMKLSRLLLEESEEKELLTLLQEQEILLQKERPHALLRMINSKALKDWNEKLNSIRRERLQGLERLHKCKVTRKEVSEQYLFHSTKESDVIKDLLDKAILFHLYQSKYEMLRNAHPTSHLPNNIEELKQRDNQTQSYYQTDETNRLRSELFIAAMTLHEAWLAETLRVKGGFRGNLLAIANILQGKSPSTADDTRRAWQSLFLLIPVISSTFASIGRLFRHLEPGTLGWVLIDEAGQASPQAAVGAIWRAKRVFSIGDPFQIQPICPIPEEVVDGLAKSKIKDHTLTWAPSQVSVQNVIDRISVFGTKRTIRDESYWISSPLRVHRRCLEPMFTISNLIAYENSMLLATQPHTEFPLPPSCWWDVGGYTSDRQYVSDQGEILVHLLKKIFISIPDPDLYVISPFREVINRIQQLLIQEKELKELFKEKFPTVSFQTWIYQAIGTVHAFQGKQALVVFFVLGADKSNLGAIDWASRKPNLLNVAVTRAKSRFYMIGDYDLWKKWPYFEIAAKQLERCKVNSSKLEVRNAKA